MPAPDLDPDFDTPPAAPPPARGLPPGVQVILTRPDAMCDNCRLPLRGTGYESRAGREVRVVCAGCLAFLAQVKEAT